MRRARFKAEASVQVAHYHCVSRVVDRNFVLGELEKETFVKLMRRYETYCGVRVLSFCIMTNHFHILLEVPKRPTPENLPTDDELVDRLRFAKSSYGAETLAQQLAALGTLFSKSAKRHMSCSGCYRLGFAWQTLNPC